MTSLLDVEFYRDVGYVLARAVFGPDELAMIRGEVDALFERAEAAGRNVEATWRGQWREVAGLGGATATASATKLDSIHNLQNHSALFTRLLVDPAWWTAPRS